MTQVMTQRENQVFYIKLDLPLHLKNQKTQSPEHSHPFETRACPSFAPAKLILQCDFLTLFYFYYFKEGFQMKADHF